MTREEEAIVLALGKCVMKMIGAVQKQPAEDAGYARQDFACPDAKPPGSTKLSIMVMRGTELVELFERIVHGTYDVEVTQMTYDTLPPSKPN